MDAVTSAAMSARAIDPLRLPVGQSTARTDIFSEILKGIDSHIVAQATAYRAIFGRHTISTITVLEVVKGLHLMQREDRIEQFLDGLVTVDVLTLDVQSADLAGHTYAEAVQQQQLSKTSPI